MAVKRIRNKQKAVDYLGGQCSKCGYKKSLAGLDFHHLRDKKDLVSTMILETKAWYKIQEELDKCELLCANCHREEHDINLQT